MSLTAPYGNWIYKRYKEYANCRQGVKVKGKKIKGTQRRMPQVWHKWKAIISDFKLNGTEKRFVAISKEKTITISQESKNSVIYSFIVSCDCRDIYLDI